jgi:hypothetical protein
MDREQLLKGLSEYKFVLGHGPDLSKKTDAELETMLRLLKASFEET